MIFQSLEFKKGCVGIYTNGELIYDDAELLLKEGSHQTWGYSNFLQDKTNIEYANLYCNGAKLADVCPEGYKEDFRKLQNKMTAHQRSFREAKVNINNVCLYDLFSEKLLKEYNEYKNKITEHVIKNYEKKEDYSFLVELVKLVSEIAERKVNINISFSKLSEKELQDPNFRKSIRSFKRVEPYVRYDVFGTRTGRLTTKKGSFPVLTFDKKYRRFVEPQSDAFIEMDYNGADVRTVMGLLELEQPREDVYRWFQKKYWPVSTRNEIKKKVFTWLNSHNQDDPVFDSLFSKSIIKEKFWNSETNILKNVYKRVLQNVDEEHALTYNIQSTTNDLVLHQAIKVNNFLKENNMKSFIAFLIHDSIVLDYVADEREQIENIRKIFEKTKLGQFRTYPKIGKDFFNMKKMKI